MKVLIEIEYLDDVINVEFEGDPEWQDDSFNFSGTHCTFGKGGTHYVDPYLVLEYATWPEEKFSVEQNKVIQTYYDKHFDEIEKRFGEQFESMQ
jgi:hypothetical protein